MLINYLSLSFIISPESAANVVNIQVSGNWY